MPEIISEFWVSFKQSSLRMEKWINKPNTWLNYVYLSNLLVKRINKNNLNTIIIENVYNWIFIKILKTEPDQLEISMSYEQ